MKLLLLLLAIVALALPAELAARKNGRPTEFIKTTPGIINTASGSGVAINSQNAGPTPFVSLIHMTVSPANALKSIRFTVAPKAGSVTRPVSALYTAAYLQNGGYLNTSTGQLTFPVFGLYSNFSNTVTLNSMFTDGSAQQDVLNVPTGIYTNTCFTTTPTVVLQPRTNDTDLSYDYIMVRTSCNNDSPIVIDTDGVIRWVGTAGNSSLASRFFENSIYISTPPPAGSAHTGLSRIELDGTKTFLHDYANISVTESGHHTYERGRDGLLLLVDTTTQTESTILEVDPCGNVLRSWNFANIISAAMTAGGDNPASFVGSGSTDWFHNNAACYRLSDDSLIVSSRENFVICVDYDTAAIKWILGDTTKQWYQFASLRQYALTLGPNTLPPIGEHSLSITYDDNLLCFDNGTASSHHTPAGGSHPFSMPRKYHIDTQAKVATELWNYPNNPSVQSSFCSSVYEDAPLNYLVDYAMIGPMGAQNARILGLNAAGTKIFDYQYPANGCGTAWNSLPIHFENMRFTGPDPADDPAGWQTSVMYRTGEAVVSFRGLAGKTYRVEFKNSVTDASWQSLADRAFQCNGPAVVTDITNLANRIYRVRQLP